VRTLAVMHLAELTGPPVSLYPRLAALAEQGELETLVPGHGPVEDMYSELGAVTVVRYTALTLPSLRSSLGAVRALLRDTRTIRRLIKQRRPDLVVVATSAIPAALWAARRERVASIAYVAEIYERPDDRSWKRAVLKAPLLRFTHRYASRIVAASDAVARQFGSRGAERVTTIHPGIPACRTPLDREGARSKLGLPVDSFCIAVVGSLTPARGQDLVIRALPRLRGTVPDVYCLLAGVPHPRAVDLEYRDELGRLAAALGVENRVVFSGLVNPVVDAYAAADIVINPRRDPEPFGRVGFEALAAGRPVVLARSGAMPDLLRDGVHALFVDPDEPAEIAKAVLRLYRDSNLRDRLADAGRRHVAQNFTQAAGSDAFMRVAMSAIGRTP
jgi:glycosyltransferase involved in cell wall biosynthesis